MLNKGDELHVQRFSNVFPKDEVAMDTIVN
jgi:hypothetical protein